MGTINEIEEREYKEQVRAIEEEKRERAKELERKKAKARLIKKVSANEKGNGWIVDGEEVMRDEMSERLEVLYLWLRENTASKFKDSLEKRKEKLELRMEAEFVRLWGEIQRRALGVEQKASDEFVEKQIDSYMKLEMWAKDVVDDYEEGVSSEEERNRALAVIAKAKFVRKQTGAMNLVLQEARGKVKKAIKSSAKRGKVIVDAMSKFKVSEDTTEEEVYIAMQKI